MTRFRSTFTALALALALAGAAPASALETFDFETPYLVHPGQQVWDFALVRAAGTYHAFYHAIPQHAAHPANADTIWHAVSDDLVRWSRVGPVLNAGPDWYDAEAMWAPDVVYDPTTARWAMLYTGVTANMVQRACLAWSDDLATWTKSPANPVFAPDTLLYHWAPDQAWSSFRDPYVYHDGAQWNMLSTAAARLGGYPGLRRGIVHHAVSADLEHWTDAGALYTHNGTVGRTRDLESVQYLVRDGWHHLFFVEQDLDIDNHPTSHLVAADPSGWDMTQRTYVDAGWAPEIEQFDAGAPMAVFARLAKDQDPRDGTWFVTMRCDSVRFDDGGRSPVVVMTDPWAADWPVRTGTAQPAFGENAVLRGGPVLGVEGHGWFSTRENYSGPLAGVGLPGAAWGDANTGRIESRPFTITGGYLSLLLAGGYYANTCYVALLDDATGAELSRLHVNNTGRLAERRWDLGAWPGRTVRLAVVDAEAGPEGWIAVDRIEERDGDLSAVEIAPRGATGRVTAWPNPFNPRTTIRFTAGRAGVAAVTVHDLAGRRVWRSAEAVVRAGEAGEVVWNGRDRTGRPMGSGTYLARVTVDGRTIGRARLVLVQ